MEKGVQRWLVDISKWDPSRPEFSFALSLLPQHQRPSVLRYWCVKEAFVKAIGSGLAFGLDKVEFHHTGWTNVHVKVNGATLQDWKFWLHELGGRHCLGVAKGHPRLATDSYKRPFRQLDFSEEEYIASLHLPGASFVLKTVGELVSILASSKSDVTGYSTEQVNLGFSPTR